LKFELTDFSVLFVTAELSPICSFRKRSLNTRTMSSRLAFVGPVLSLCCLQRTQLLSVSRDLLSLETSATAISLKLKA
jgi:hypothetical protein